MAKQPLREYQPENGVEGVDFLEAWTSPRNLAEFLEKLQPGEKIASTFRVENPNDTRKMQRFVAGLRECGVDIGKGEAEYGFKMPLPEKDVYHRDLVIFRRR